MTAVGYTGGDPNKVDVAGDTMTGPLILSGDPVVDLGAATKQYADAGGGGGGGSGTPSNTVVAETSYSQASTAGAATAYSRGDHTHGTPALPTPAAIGASVSTHNHTGTYDPSGSAAAALTSALAADVLLTSSTPTAEAIGDTGVVGVGTTSARSDHRHAMPSFGNVVAETSFGQASGNGSASSVARSDHTHGTPTAPTVPSASSSVASETTYGQASSAGVAATFSRGDHTHGTQALPTPAAIGASATGHSHVESDVTSLVTDLAAKAPLASPTFTGTPSLPTGTTGVTQTAGNSTTALATTAFVTTADNLKANIASPTFTGVPAAPTAAQGTNTTQLATTQYVQTEVGLLVPKSLFTAKGTIVAASAANTPAGLAVGSNGDVLTVDSAQSLGVKWAAPSGGGSTEYNAAAFPTTGRWYRAPSFGPVGANLTGVLNRLYLVPFRLGQSTTFDRIGFDLAVVSAATGVCRLGIWAADAAGRLPGTLILDAGTVAVDSGTGSKTITISQLLAAGTYWIGICNQVAAGGTALRATVNYDPLLPYFTGANAVTGTESAACITTSGVTGAFASTPVPTDNDRGPLLSLRSA